METRRLVNQGSHYTMKIYQCEEGEEEVVLFLKMLFQLIFVKG